MKIKLERINDRLAFRATNEEGLFTHIDAAATVGGEGSGMRPMELLASSLASCASIDVLLILEKQKIRPQAYAVDVIATRKDAVPAVFENIHLVFSIGKSDPVEKVRKAVQLSVEKYCSVAAMISAVCTITYEIKNEITEH